MVTWERKKIFVKLKIAEGYKIHERSEKGNISTRKDLCEEVLAYYESKRNLLVKLLYSSSYSALNRIHLVRQSATPVDLSKIRSHVRWRNLATLQTFLQLGKDIINRWTQIWWTRGVGNSSNSKPKSWIFYIATCDLHAEASSLGSKSFLDNFPCVVSIIVNVSSV